MSKEPDSKPIKVAGRFGVVRNTDGWDPLGWRVAEIIGPTGLYITHGWYAFKGKAIEAAAAYAAKESPVPEAISSTPNPPFRPQTLNLYQVGPLQEASDDDLTDFIVAAGSVYEARVTCFRHCETQSTNINADLCEKAPVLLIGTTDVYLEPRVLLAASIGL